MRRKYFKSRSKVEGTPKKYNIGVLTQEQRLVFELICSNVMPSGGHPCEPTIANLMLFYYIMEGLKINPGYAIVKYMLKRAKDKSDETIPYGQLITTMIKKKGIRPVSRPEPVMHYTEKWLRSKGLALGADGVIKKKKDGASSSSARGVLSPGRELQWRERMVVMMGQLSAEIEQVKLEQAKETEMILEFGRMLDLEPELSDEEGMPDFSVQPLPPMDAEADDPESEAEPEEEDPEEEEAQQLDEPEGAKAGEDPVGSDGGPFSPDEDNDEMFKVVFRNEQSHNEDALESSEEEVQQPSEEEVEESSEEEDDEDGGKQEGGLDDGDSEEDDSDDA